VDSAAHKRIHAGMVTRRENPSSGIHEMDNGQQFTVRKKLG
jgi:hypothetical protein